jgi:transmembrane sensor
MSLNLTPEQRAESEAAQWFARLSNASVQTEVLSDFFEWRRDPLNDQAYRTLERFWRSGETLAKDQGIQSALEAALARKPRRRTPVVSRWYFGSAGALVALAALGIVLSRPLIWADQVYETRIGEQRTVVLSDGSKVRLDTNSRITAQMGAQRSIALIRGQALFDVVHMASRPMTVRAGPVMIRDLGTRFDVRRDDQQVRVTLVDGAVQISDQASGKRWSLAPGQQITAGRAAPSPPHTIDVERATDWTRGHLTFDELPLSLATAEINRYTRQPIRLEAPDLNGAKVSGIFNQSDPQEFASAVAKLYNLEVVAQPDGGIVLKKPSLN